MNKFTAGYYFWVNILIALGAFAVLRKKKVSKPYMLFVLIALAYFSAHLFIEVQTRYRSLMTVVTYPLIATSVDALVGSVQSPRLGKLFSKKKQLAVK